MAKKASKKTVETLKHTDDRRANIPTAEPQSVMRDDEQGEKGTDLFFIKFMLFFWVSLVLVGQCVSPS